MLEIAASSYRRRAKPHAAELQPAALAAPGEKGNEQQTFPMSSGRCKFLSDVRRRDPTFGRRDFL